MKTRKQWPTERKLYPFKMLFRIPNPTYSARLQSYLQYLGIDWELPAYKRTAQKTDQGYLSAIGNKLYVEWFSNDSSWDGVHYWRLNGEGKALEIELESKLSSSVGINEEEDDYEARCTKLLEAVQSYIWEDKPVPLSLFDELMQTIETESDLNVPC